MEREIIVGNIEVIRQPFLTDIRWESQQKQIERTCDASITPEYCESG